MVLLKKKEELTVEEVRPCIAPIEDRNTAKSVNEKRTADSTNPV